MLCRLTRVGANVECYSVCLIVFVNLGPTAAISRGEQNRYGSRRRTLTARLIKFYGGLPRRLMALKAGPQAASGRVAATRPVQKAPSPLFVKLMESPDTPHSLPVNVAATMNFA